MSSRISDIPTHNAAPGGASKIELENPTGPTSEWTTLAEAIAANAGVAGFRFTFNSATSGDPGTGKFLFNNSAFASATQLNISSTDANGNDLSTYLLTCTTFTGRCEVRKPDGSYFSFSFGAMAYLEGTYFTLPITPGTSGGTISNADTVYLTLDTTSASASFPRITQVIGTSTVAEVEAATKAVRMTPARGELPSNYDLFAISSYRLGGSATYSGSSWNQGSSQQQVLQMAWNNGPGFAVIRQITLGMYEHTLVGTHASGPPRFDLFRYPYAQIVTTDASGNAVKSFGGNIGIRMRSAMRGSNMLIAAENFAAFAFNPTAAKESQALGELVGAAPNVSGQTLIPLSPIYEAAPGVEPLILQGWDALAALFSMGPPSTSSTGVLVFNIVWDEWTFNPPR